MGGRLAGRVALVTGSTNNIGRAVARAFADEGARVVVTGRDPARGTRVVEAISSAGGQASFFALELDGSVERSRELAARAAGVFGPIEILVNNAGVYPPGGTLAVDGATFDRIFAVNVKAPYFLTAAVVPAMVDAARGVVINLGSWGARLGLAGGTAYSATKGAMETLTRAWSAEFGASGVRVNGISPGVTFDEASPVAELAAPMMATTPLGRLVTPDAVARAAVFLASDDATDIHGTVLDVDGGRAHVHAAGPALFPRVTTLTPKGAATRQRIIEGAAQVIRTVGIEAATLDAIREHTLTSKSQLFHYFPDGRRELLLAVARHEADRVLTDQQPHLSTLTTWDAWQRWRTVVVRRYRAQGRTCPLALLMTELGRSDPAAQAVTRSLLLRWRNELAAGVRAMQAAGASTPVADANRYAGAILAAVQGGVAIILATGSSADLEAALDVVLGPLRPPAS